MSEEKKLSYFLNESKNLDPQNSNHKIKSAILCSFTINGLAECLQVKSHTKKINCQTYVGQYNQYNQEILDKNSQLYKFSPDLTFLLIDVRSMLGELFYTPYSLSTLEKEKFIENKINELKNLIIFFTNQTK